FIMSILSKATGSFGIHVYGQLQINDPATFLRALNSSSVSEVRLNDRRDESTLLFDLPLTFWEKFINENLSNGSFEWVEVGWYGTKITQAPINLPDFRIERIVWKKAETK
ncbi:hypothetical protein PMAYCL1PPCAC_00814, partial [Pristionchus mayeri]